MKEQQSALGLPEGVPLHPSSFIPHPSSLIPHPSAKWPKSLAAQAQAIRAALTAPTDAAALAKTFKGAKADRVEDILETLASLGQARALKGGKYVSA